MKHPLFGEHAPQDWATEGAGGQGRRALSSAAHADGALTASAGPVRHLGPVLERLADSAQQPRSGVVDDDLVALFDVQAAARWLGLAGGSEGLGAVGLALRATDPVFAAASGIATLMSHAGADSLRRVSDLPLSRPNAPAHPAGRADHVLAALGAAWALGRQPAGVRAARFDLSWPDDAIAVAGCTGVDVDRSEVLSVLHAASRVAVSRFPLPLLLVVADDGSEPFARSPTGWVRTALAGHAGVPCVAADSGADPVTLTSVVAGAVRTVREDRRPLVLHLRRVELGAPGTSGRDPLAATMTGLVRRQVLTGAAVGERFLEIRDRVAKAVADADAVTETDVAGDADATKGTQDRAPAPGVVAGEPLDDARRERAHGGTLPEAAGPLHLADTLRAALLDAALSEPRLVLIGAGAARSGGSHGVTLGLQRRLGAARVVDSLADVNPLTGLSVGATLAGLLPVVEVPDLAAARELLERSGSMLSRQAVRAPMVIRAPLHPGDAVGSLRELDDVVVACCSQPAAAAGLLRAVIAHASSTGATGVLLEPVPLYRERDAIKPRDGGWLEPYSPPVPSPASSATTGASVVVPADEAIVTIASYGDGVRLALRAAAVLADEHLACRVVDIRWLSPLPVDDVLREAIRTGHLIVADGSRPEAGISEGLVTGLLEAGFDGRLARVTAPLTTDRICEVARVLGAL